MICTDQWLMLEMLASLSFHGETGLIPNFSPNKEDWQNVFHNNYFFVTHELLVSDSNFIISNTGVL